ncbi:MAG: phosphatidate cytidylyltransferase [Angelakisella sp.]|jgi:phosphatidate cytidylyltransferase|nr:phosphatidate cytidylyltransferase [Angelakisella sp.]
MKKRIISAAGGLALLAVVVIFFDTLLVNFLAAGICLLALFEIFKAADLLRFRVLTGVCGVFCVLILFLNTNAIAISFSYLSYLLVVLLFVMLLRDHDKLRVEQVAYSFLMSILLAVSFYCLILLKEQTGPQMGMFYMLLIFGSAWWADSGAYFVGTFLGKHKLCPHVSPKKTVEGLIGGIVTAVIGNVLVCLVFQAFCNWVVPWGYIKNAVTISIPAVALVTPFATLLGVLGDLSASVIKRQYGIKDFGNIMPGHGGAMDRFDSVLFISPLFYFIFNILPLISAI